MKQMKNRHQYLLPGQFKRKKKKRVVLKRFNRESMALFLTLSGQSDIIPR